ncbi:hypothetical protein EXS74_00990 [Candidatus Woesearchaeota archaeon]|nr:hypothetical protein [Candidatus Woesearchaeota archaeon]
MKSLSTRVYEYVVENTGIVVEITPFFAAYESFVLDMDTSVSEHARLFGGGILYLGLGTAFTKGREWSENLFGVHERSEGVQMAHDIAYNTVFTAAVSPLTYIVAGETDISTIIFGTLGGAVLGMLNGAPVGYAIDVAKDLMDVKECTRGSYPSALGNASSFQKKMLAVGLLLGSLATTEAIYKLHDHFSLEQTIVSQ